MELRHVRYFLAVAEARNFTRAAEKVGIGQPPLSQQIRALEDELGTKLFHRRSYGAELTERAKRFCPKRRRCCSRPTARCARHAMPGTVNRDSCASALPARPRSARSWRRRCVHFVRAIPPSRCRSKKRYGAAAGRHRGQAARRCVHPAGTRRSGRRHGAAYRRRTDAGGVPASHRLARSATVRLADLASETLLLFPRRAGPALFDDLLAACRRAGFDPDLQQETPQITSVANLVAAGFGISIVPAPIAQVQVAGVVYLRSRGRRGRTAGLGDAPRRTVGHGQEFHRADSRRANGTHGTAQTALTVRLVRC